MSDWADDWAQEVYSDALTAPLAAYERRTTREVQIAVIAAALRKAVADQREADAKIADQAALQYNAAWVAEPIAARIRGGETKV